MPEEKKIIPFRSPKNLSEEKINDIIQRVGPDFERAHINRVWNTLSDAKEIHKLVLDTISGQSNRGFSAIYALITFAMQMGFDLHAAYGDAGSAALYAPDEEREFKKAKKAQEGMN